MPTTVHAFNLQVAIVIHPPSAPPLWEGEEREREIFMKKRKKVGIGFMPDATPATRDAVKEEEEEEPTCGARFQTINALDIFPIDHLPAQGHSTTDSLHPAGSDAKAQLKESLTLHWGV